MTSLASRTRAAFAFDSPLARLLVLAFGVFVTSVSFLAANLPLIAFFMLVGWQPTHAAILLFGVAALPVIPSVFGALSAADRMLAERADAAAGRAFWAGFAYSTRRFRPAALAMTAVVAVLSYDAALFSGSDAVVLLVVAGTACLIAGVVALAATSLALPNARGAALVVAAALAAVRRPHLALAWLMLVTLACAVCFAPMIGPSLLLFAPGLAAVAIQICNRALGSFRAIEENAS